MATITPTWTDTGTAIVGPTTVARAATAEVTIDLRTKRYGYLLVRLGRQGTTALTDGVNVRCRRTINNDAAGHPASGPEATSQSVAAQSTTINSDSNSGQPALNVASSTSFAAGDRVLVESADGAHTRIEWGIVSKVAVGVITLDRNLKNTHTSVQADTVRNKADAWTFYLDGGATWAVVFDYGNDAAGESVTIEGFVQTYDSDASA
jgi:hypothetical protein